MKISELAKRCGISVRMLRFYEQLQLITPTRTINGYRQYTEQDIEYVRKIKLLNQTGLALKEIALLRHCLNAEQPTLCDKLQIKLKAKQNDIDKQIDLLQQSKVLISQMLGNAH